MSASLHGSYRAGFTPLTQIRLTNVAYLRYYKCGHRFEIACYRNKVLNWRAKIETDIREVLQVEAIFTNVSKGNLANAKQLNEAFGTTDTLEISKEMLDRGELQVSEEERQAQYDIMFTDIAAIVSEKSVHPDNNRPYTTPIIQNAMKQIHYSVSINKSAKKQALDVINRLRAVMPIARVQMLLSVIVPTVVAANMELLLMSLNKPTTPAAATGQGQGHAAVTITQGGSYTSGSNLVGMMGTPAGVPSSESPATVNNLSTTTIPDSISADAGMYFFNVRVNPEHYKTIVDFVKELCQGQGQQGRVEILKLKDMDSSCTSAAITGVTAGAGAGVSSGDAIGMTAVVGSIGEHSTLETAAAVATVGEFEGKNEVDDDNDDDDNQSETLLLQQHTGGTGGFAAFEVDSDSEVEAETEAGAEAVLVGDAVVSSADNGDSGSEEEEEEEEDLEAAVDRLMRERAEAKARDRAAAAKKKEKEREKAGKGKKGKKAKKGKPQQGEEEEEEGNGELVNEPEPESEPIMTPPSPTVAAAETVVPAPGAIACRTCGGNFPDAAAHREHFKSEWHRHNLRQKMLISAGAAGRILTEQEFHAATAGIA